LLILIVVFLLKKEPFKILTHYEEKKNKDIDQLLNSIKIDEISSESKEFLKDKLEYYFFKKYQGVSANRSMRKNLIEFYQTHEGEISWHDLRIAFPYMNLDKGKIKINIKTQSILGRWLVSILSWLIGIYSVSIMLIAAYFEFTKQDGSFKLSAFALITLAAALGFSALNWPYHSAQKIKTLISSEDNN